MSARHKAPTRRARPRCRSRRRAPSTTDVLFRALGFVLFFASSVFLVVALIAAASLDVWAGAFGGLLSVVAAMVGYGLVARFLP